MTLPCFKAYDIRGRIPDELDEDLARNVALAFAVAKRPRKVVVGRDMRLSSDAIAGAVIDGFLQAGVDVVDIGLCGTEMVYFATFHLEAEGVDGGVIVTASHNPADYNGMKLVTKGAQPISGDSGLKDIERLAEAGVFEPAAKRGKVEGRSIMAAYLDHLLSYVDVKALRPFHLVANAGNGCAGLVLDQLAPRLPFTWTKLYNDPDGTFPHGVPNPLLEENRGPTIAAVQQHKAALGLAWDGDFDRCFFFDETGQFIEGYYMVGLLAAELLAQAPGSAVIHDPRLVWNTVELVTKAGGRPVQSKTGHAFIKERMRKEDAIYGGEMSAHHYFKRFAYCDSGMIPWLVVAQTMSRTGKGLGELVREMQASFPASGEINLKLKDAGRAIAAVRARYGKEAIGTDETDGLSLEFPRWRLNVRMSNTEPVVRLNVEARADPALMRAQTDAVLAVLKQAG